MAQGHNLYDFLRAEIWFGTILAEVSLSQTQTGWTGALALQTAVAIFLALVVYIVVASLASIVFFYGNNILTLIRPGILQFFAVIVGSVAGMAAARSACDAVLKAYSPRSVFVSYAIVTAFLVAVEVFYVPRGFNQIVSAAQIVSALLAAYAFFWQQH